MLHWSYEEWYVTILGLLLHSEVGSPVHAMLHGQKSNYQMVA